ncbi:MAG: LysE family translocator [Acidimicrobiales bacterium]
MQLVLLGITFGMLTVAMPGPISVSLVQVASRQGRRSGARAALGVAGGDVVLSIVAVTCVSAGAVLSEQAFAAVQVVSAVFLVAFGLLLLGRPVIVEERATYVTRPLRTFLTLTTLMPTALGSWLALLAAMPFADHRASLAAFALGVVLVSLVWHPVVGLSAGSLGPRLRPAALRLGTRAGGIATIGTGVWAMV